MAQTFLIFNFGGDEKAAQQARHRIDGWRQGFRLDKKLQLKFDRNQSGDDRSTAPSSKDIKGKRKANASSADGPEAEKKSSTSASPSDICMIVRLDFSDHEKLSHHRWVERIPSEDLFKTAAPKIVRSGDPDFASTADHFDSLD